MAQTLSPNTQITQANVGLLKAGDWLRGIWDGSLWMFDRLTISPGRMVVRRPYKGTTEEAREEIDAFTYIGPDLGDGWIGWGGGENPVPGMSVSVRYNLGENEMGESDCFLWEPGSSDRFRIIAFRPALAKPAEDHIGDATEMIDWERVGPKLVEALKDAREHIRGSAPEWHYATQDAVKAIDDALAPATPGGK